MFRLIETDAPRDAIRGARAGMVAVLLHAGIVTGAVVATRVRAEPARPELVGDLPWILPEPTRVTHPSPLVDNIGSDMVDVPPGLPPFDMPLTIHGGGLEPGAPWSPAGPAPVGDVGLGTVYAPALVDDYPELLAAPPPQYPELLRRAGIEGRVVLEATVDTLGRVERGSVVVVLTPHPGFATPAVAYLERALFRPARVQGRAVRVRIRQGIDFRLRR